MLNPLADGAGHTLTFNGTWLDSNTVLTLTVNGFRQWPHLRTPILRERSAQAGKARIGLRFCFGIDLARWKITAFTLGNFLAGVAGALYAMMLAFIAPHNFTFADGLIIVSIVLLGGLGNPWGVVVAAMIVIILPEKLQVFQEYRFLLFAVTARNILAHAAMKSPPGRKRRSRPDPSPEGICSTLRQHAADGSGMRTSGGHITRRTFCLPVTS